MKSPFYNKNVRRSTTFFPLTLCSRMRAIPFSPSDPQCWRSKSRCVRCECSPTSAVIFTARIYSGVWPAVHSRTDDIGIYFSFHPADRLMDFQCSLMHAPGTLCSPSHPPCIHPSIFPSLLHLLSNNYKERAGLKEIKDDTDIKKRAWNNTTLEQIMSFLSADCVPGSGRAGNWSGKLGPLNPPRSVSNADQPSW